MAKLLNLMLLVFATQIALTLFVNPTYPFGALYNFLLNPFDWSTTDLIALLNDTLAVAGLGLIVIGTFFYKNDFVTFAGITATFFSFGTALYNLWQYVDSKGIFGGHGWVAALFVSPMVLMYLYVILEFWRGKD